MGHGTAIFWAWNKARLLGFYLCCPKLAIEWVEPYESWAIASRPVCVVVMDMVHVLSDGFGNRIKVFVQRYLFCQAGLILPYTTENGLLEKGGHIEKSYLPCPMASAVLLVSDSASTLFYFSVIIPTENLTSLPPPVLCLPCPS